MKAFKFLAIGGLLLTIGHLYAQINPKTVKHSGKTYLAGGVFDGGKLSAKAFDSLIRLPLVSMDTLNQPHDASFYNVTYIERNLYEDSLGRPEIIADYFSFDCFDGKIPDVWLKSLKVRLKQGDTILINNVTSFYNDKKLSKFYTKPIGIVISK